jgi:uncharacterized peroxidase-related enzyme
MAFIETVDPSDASGAVSEMYARQRAHYGYVPNYAKVFSHRPEVLRLWAALLAGIRRPMDRRRFELVTFAAARELRNAYCSLAHGTALLDFMSPEELRALLSDDAPKPLSSAEATMMRFAEKVARDASSVAADDVEALRGEGFSDAEIFDIAATAAGRAFFTKILDALGAKPDAEIQDPPHGLHDLLAKTAVV